MKNMVAGVRHRYLRDLQKRCNSILSDKQAMYAKGRWTGILNALDEHSPHAVQTLGECAYWHREGVMYLQQEFGV